MAADDAPPVAHAPFSFAGSVRPTELSWAYRFGLLVVAGAMLLLPLVYLGVIVLSAAGVWWHLTAHAWWMQGGSTGAQWRATAYIAPAVAGTVVTFFMIKPVFARRPAFPDPLVVTASQHPALFAFITEICRHVRAPVPRLVQVDCQVNASAGFAPGLRSVFQRDLVLTIGLPLVRALSVREFGGVLAHEFGHFAQGSGLTLTMLVRGINRWFSRVVYERDSWDARLDHWSQRRDRLSVLIMPSRAAVWFSRRILTLLMVGGHAISCFMTRQMEYDADSYEVKIAGSDTFASTMRRLSGLGRAVNDSAPHIRRELAKGRLPGDLPLFLVTWQLTGPVPSTPAHDHTSRRTSLFDTHPSDGDRIAAAARAGDPGILAGGNETATALFDNFDWLSRHATRRHYEDRGRLDGVSLVDAVKSVQAAVGREERQQALITIFDLGISRYRGLTLVWPSTAPSPETEPQTSLRPEAIGRFNDLVAQRTGAFAAQELIRTGCGGFDPAPFGLSTWTLDAAVAKERTVLEQMAALDREIAPYERVRLGRIARGLDRLAASGDEEYSSANLAALVQALNAAAAALEGGVDVARLGWTSAVLTDRIESGRQPQAARERRDALTLQIDEGTARMRQALAGAPCPVLLDPRAATLEDACGSAKPGLEPVDVVNAAELLYSRLFFELCWLAVRGESSEAPEAAAI